MSLREQQKLLAKLYTDAELRRAFLSKPGEIGAQYRLTAVEIEEIAGVMPEELNFFADSLVGKRLREAEKFLPLTRAVLGKDFAELFREFSGTFNPQSIKKHFEDALEFCRYLQRRKLPDSAANVVRFERSKLDFFGNERRFVICRLDYDFESKSGTDLTEESVFSKKRKKIAVWVRFGKRIKHFFI